MNDELLKKIKRVNTEDFVWGVYLVIIVISFYANYLERDFLINNNRVSRKEYKDLETVVFTLAVLIYIYFVVTNYQKLTDRNDRGNMKSKQIVFVAAIFALISGILFLYASVKYKNDSLEVEI